MTQGSDTMLEIVGVTFLQCETFLNIRDMFRATVQSTDSSNRWSIVGGHLCLSLYLLAL